MIYNVMVYDEYGYIIDVYRIGAWHECHAEDIVSTKIVKTFKETSPDISYKLIPEGKLFLVVPPWVEEITTDFLAEVS